MLKKSSNTNVPPLRDENGIWALSAVDKAELLSKVFQEKFQLPPNPDTVGTGMENFDTQSLDHGFLLVRSRWARKLMEQLDDSTATGPDGLPSLILKKCARELSYPVAKLVRLILLHGVWPETWRIHWILPLYKRMSRSLPKNYRGIHLTNQLSKIVERFIGKLFLPRVQDLGLFGPRQFAYSQGKSYKDAPAVCVCEWIWALCHNGRIGLYCSDVAGAFDRVSSERLLNELSSLNLPESIFKVLRSWLECRTAYVIVNNKRSHHFCLKDMVFQGTVLGPPL